MPPAGALDGGREVLIDSIVSRLASFFRSVASGEVEIYNEFSLQHELGCFLRQHLPPRVWVQFERPVSFFQKPSFAYVKKEIDITVFGPDRSERVAIELKFPRNGQYPEQMFSACCDLVFLEQLVSGGFAAGLFVMAVDDHRFRTGREVSGVYACFRGAAPITGTIAKPTGKTATSIDVRGSYTIDWYPAGEKLHYCSVVVSPESSGSRGREPPA